MGKILTYIKPYVPKMILGLIIKFTGTIMDLLLPWILSYTIDEIVPQKNVTLVFIWGFIMILCAVAALVTNIIANRMASKVARDTTQAIRHDLFEKISYLSCRQIDEFTIPSLESRLTSDTYNIHQMVGMMQRLGVRAPILLLGGIIITLMLEPVLSLIMILTLPFIGLLVYLVSKKSIPLYTSLQRSVDVLVRTVRENITGIRVIKALSKTAYEKNRFFEVNSNVVKNEKKAAVTMALTNPVMNLLLNLGLTLVIVAGAWRINAGLTQSGEIIAFLTYFTLISNAMLSVTRMFVIYSKGSASAERIRQVLETPEDLALGPKDHVDNGYHVTFENVSFKYHKGESSKSCIEDISFALKKGETLGIIGATGSGKSTIIRLLMRLYDPDKGRIRISGDDVRCIPEKELHTMFGTVFQNDFLYADTIESNIAFGREPGEGQLELAISCAQAGEFIDNLPEGRGHLLTMKGSNLSGGQKQRVLISRALAAKPEILILDDSSSALDYKTDSLLRKALADSFKDTTTIIIAQRTSSIMHADHILILEDGKALGYGTHEELLGSCDVYREICTSQMGGGAIA
ncbi:MAG TPA: ABC transporter ATP-binding protein [Clostridia bacterium]|nr:ABC transporter ATP-binding protein [Clostridia bacterium]